MSQASTDKFADALRPLVIQFMRAYMECSDQIQASIREMMEIINSPDSDDDERAMAEETIAEAILPRVCDGQLGADLAIIDEVAATNRPDGVTALEEVDQEEETFAERLRVIMDQKGVTQDSLAKQVGVGQSAVCMMLNRDCRPQRRTIGKIAKALSVSPKDLWPSIE